MNTLPPLKTFSIGDIRVDPGLILAPMSGVTNICFRRLIQEENPGSVGLVVTEFISIEALTRQNLRSLQMMRFREEERPISIQIFGHDVKRMVESAQMIEDAGADIIDINCGCPVPKVVKKGGGCELMRQSDHLEVVLKEVKKHISIPLTLKIRSGWDEESRNALEVAQMAEAAGIAMLAIHGRTRSLLYRGEADWDIVEEVASQLSIPVVGSGDITSAESYGRLYRPSVAGYMIGRAALSDPWVFRDLQSAITGKSDSSSLLERSELESDLEVVRVLRRYVELLQEEFEDRGVMGRLKQFASQVTRGVRGSTHARRALCQSRKVEEFSDVLNRWADFLVQRQGSNDSIVFDGVKASEEKVREVSV